MAAARVRFAHFQAKDRLHEVGDPLDDPLALKDATAREATGAGARVVSSARGRAKQMNMGAKASSPSSDVLLFLHADTLLPEDWATRLCREVEK